MSRTAVTLVSRHDPGTAARGLVLLRAQSEALAWASFAVMAVTVVAMLQGSAVLVPVGVGMVAAVLASGIVARARLRRLPARIDIEGASARVWSVWDAARPARRPPAEAVWEARLVLGELVVSLGDAVETFARSDWDDFDALIDGLRAAATRDDGATPV
ncbi:MAG TPA: hypothetical protein VGB53_11605 [Rubricoccaceae bacterium]|jgi:hypothetical protein